VRGVRAGGSVARVNLTVFGAAGATGRPLAAQALERGHAVTAFVRSAPGAELFPGVDRVVTGDARNADAVRSALQVAEAVVSVMGPKGPDPGTMYSDGIGTLAGTMVEVGPRRLVLSANSRVLDDRELWGSYADVSQEHRHALAAVRACDLDWTFVATPMLSDDEPRGAYQAVVGARSAGSEITRADYATALLDALDHPGWVAALVDVSNAD
jgi:putative NADH-flavin reductase